MMDGGLISTCKKMLSAHRRWLEAITSGDDDEIEEAHRKVFILVAKIEAIVPTTIAGFEAKARAALTLWCDGETAIVDQSDETTILARSVVRDLANRAEKS